MNARLLTRHSALTTAGRFHLPARIADGKYPAADAPITSTETLVLLGCGIVAAVGVLLIDFSLKLPGHAILRAVPPMALGLSLVPRRGSGTVMGIGALATIGVILGAGLGEKGHGATVSLTLIGPVLDLAMRSSTGGRRVYLAFIGAGMSANLAALAFQAGAKYLGFGGGGKPLAVWLPQALVTYPAFGAAAGLLSAAIFFRWNDRQSEPGADQR
jgi:hypothetical protein